MKNSDRISSYLASPYFAGLALFFAFLCAYFGLPTLFGYLFFLFLVSLVAWLWGRWAERGIGVDMRAQSYRVYPGQDIQVAFTLKNDKWLPLMWLQWIQPAPPNDCLTCPPEFERRNIVDDVSGKIVERVLCKRFSFIKWYATVEWTATFHGARRGVYIPQTIQIHTGDGFGLSVRKKEYTLSTPPTFVIYPKRVAVRAEDFLKNAWSASTGPHGVIEDVTVVRGTRAYESKDSFKRINWRLAARGGELSVNVYDTISPRSVYFFIDTTTFCGVEGGAAAFEDTLSVVGSLVDELFELGMSVGLYLPVVNQGKGTDITLEHTTREDCLLALALADCDHPEAHFSRQSMAHLASTQSGNIYYVCFDGAHAGGASLLEEAGLSQCSVLSHGVTQGGQAEDVGLLGMPLQCIDDFKKG